jgi:two-component system, chemotaxis family, sensor kinase CheA
MTYAPGRQPRVTVQRPRSASSTGYGETRRIPRFPGATLELDGSGQIVHAWQGVAGPALAPDPDVLRALEIDENAPDAVRVQLLLASAIGAPLEAWSVFAADAPSALQRRDGQRLLVTWSPIADCGVIGRVAMFALPAAPDPHEEPEDPVETNRICVDALALLDECEASLRYLETDRCARSAVHRMFRAMHTIKGSTRGSHLQAIADLAHDAEELIQALRDVEQAPSKLLVELAASLRRLRAAIVAARPRGEIDDAMTELMSECRPVLVDLQLSIVRLSQGDHSAASAASRALELIGVASARVNMQALFGQCTAAANAVEIVACGGDIEASLLDEIELVDRQIELYAAVHREASALEEGPSQLATMRSWMSSPESHGASPGFHEAVSQTGITSLIEALFSEDPLARRCAIALIMDAPAMFEPGRPHDDTAVYFERTQRDLLHALDDLACRVPNVELAPLRAIVQRLAWVPLTPLARRLARMVKTLATDLEKAVEAKLELANVQVAPPIARVVGEILLHAVRNALDHGLELPADRVAAGKPAEGTIDVAAYTMGERLVVSVRDDGRGIAIERIRQVAVERRLLSPEAAAAAGKPELLDLLFHPGFSTARSVTSVSGRGIGMDVIRSLAEEQGGSVVLSSTAGCGTELTIELPLAPPARS